MSSNNMLIIIKKKKKYEIHHHLCVDNKFFPSSDSLLKQFKSLISAIKFANKYCREEIVEYGYYIDDNCLK